MSKKKERTYAIDPGHYPDLLYYAFNYATMEYIAGLRVSQMEQVVGFHKRNIYRSASYNGHVVMQHWAFSYTPRKDWEHLSMNRDNTQLSSVSGFISRCKRAAGF